MEREQNFRCHVKATTTATSTLEVEDLLKPRKHVSPDQINGLLEFLQDHPHVAKGYGRGKGMVHSIVAWNICAEKLNKVVDGANKDAKGWSKFWTDWKYRVRRRALEFKAARDNNKSPPELPLTSMEETILTLIGWNAVDGIVIKSDPLADGDFVDDENMSDDVDNHQEATTASSSFETAKSLTSLRGVKIVKSRNSRKRRRSTDASDEDGERRDIVKSSSDGRVKGNRKKTTTACSEDEQESYDSETNKFLRIEREKLEVAKSKNESLERIVFHMSHLVDSIQRITDVIINNRNSYNL